jgi:hypothetical protein
MYTIHATKKLLGRVKGPFAPAVENPTTSLGNWYATVVFWRPQVALFVNERSLLPLLIPLAPAATLVERFPENLRDMLDKLGVNPAFIAAERWAMNDGSYAKTANRQVLGVMNRFEFELEYVRERYGNDLMQLSVWQSDTLAGPLRGGTRTPREELLELVEQKSM